MAEFAAKCKFFAQEYDMWFLDKHKRDARVAFDIFAFSGTDLCYSELFLKAESRAKKSASKVKIGQIVHHTVLVLKRSWYLGYLAITVCYLLWWIQICLGCKYWISRLCNIECCMSQASKININEKQGQ